MKDSVAEFNYILLHGNTDGSGYAKSQLVLDNAKVGVTGGVNGQYGKITMNGNSAIIATNDSVLDLRGLQNFGCLSMEADNLVSLTDSALYSGSI